MTQTSIERFITSGKLEELRKATPSRPKYEMIKEFLLEGLDNGYYKPGQALPSENTLIQKLGVARNTIRQAIEELVKAGLVKRIQGKGNYFIKTASNGTHEQLGVFCLILPELSRGLYPILANGFDHQAGISHQQMLLCNTDFDINKQGNIILQMIEKNVAGVAIVPAIDCPTPLYQITQLQRHNIPVVCCHRPVLGAQTPLITWDAEEVARLAGQTLADYGHRRIAYFARTRYELTEKHCNALRLTLREFGLDLPDRCVYYGSSPKNTDDELQQRKAALKAILSGPNPVTAIFCNDDNEAELIHYALMELGIRVPNDVSLMGFGDVHAREGVFLNRLKSVTINEYELGMRAAKVLNEIRKGQRPIDSEEVIYKPLSVSEGSTVVKI
jgi:DNA-binding LacI/PurR family transcriptional regulator